MTDLFPGRVYLLNPTTRTYTPFLTCGIADPNRWIRDAWEAPFESLAALKAHDASGRRIMKLGRGLYTFRNVP